MIKYKDAAVTFLEIPDEITLTLEITNCPHKCKNCHSPELREDIGHELNEDEVDRLIFKHDDITCFCFMGGDANKEEIVELANYIHEFYPDILVAMYSGDDEKDIRLDEILDYYKIGHYDEKAGPLSSKTTNQRLYKGDEDITYKFWPKEN